MTKMAVFRKHAPVLLACLALGACVQQREAAEQRDAAQYHDEQRDSAVCAGQGLLPGSDEFKVCLARLGAPPPP